MLLTLKHRLEACSEREGRLAGAGASAERDDSDLLVEQQVDCQTLLCASPVHPEHFAVAAHEPQ